jgi:hypothetical protein
MKTTYRDAAAALWGEAGTYAYDAYAQLRTAHYPELPEQLPIVIGLTAYGACIGMTAPSWDWGPRISVFSPLFGHGRRQVDDLLTHEMLHAWLFVAGQETSHNTDAWYNAVERLSPAVIGRQLDLHRGADRKSVRVPNPAWEKGNGRPKTIVRKVRVESAVQHEQVARWPQSFRPADYDWGEPMICPTY